MTALPTSISSQELEASPLPQDGPDTALSASARSTSGASECSDDTGQMSLFGETCERSRPVMLPTPRVEGFDAGRHRGQIDSLHSFIKAYPSSRQATPASHSHSPGSEWARKMTGIYGRKFADYWLSSGPPDSWVRTLLATSVWASMTCYLTWKRSATPQGRLLFRLVPSTPRTDGTGSGLWGTPQERSYKDTPGANVPEAGYLARQVYNRQMLPTPQGWDGRRGPDANRDNRPDSGGTDLTTVVGGKLNSAWVSRMMGYLDDWLTLDGEVIP